MPIGGGKNSAKAKAGKTKNSSSSEFADYFGRIYGERWLPLLEAMAAPTLHIALWNAFLGPAPSAPIEGCTETLRQGPLVAYSYDTTLTGGSYPQPPQTQGIGNFYW